MTGFWSVRGYFTEGRQRLSELLGLVPDESTERVDALDGAAWLATDQGDYAGPTGCSTRVSAEPRGWTTSARAWPPSTWAAAG